MNCGEPLTKETTCCQSPQTFDDLGVFTRIGGMIVQWKRSPCVGTHLHAAIQSLGYAMELFATGEGFRHTAKHIASEKEHCNNGIKEDRCLKYLTTLPPHGKPQRKPQKGKDNHITQYITYNQQHDKRYDSIHQHGYIAR